MKVLVLGNIGSGKTTICQNILTQDRRWQLVSIDEFRRQYGDGSLKGEYLARKHFLDEVNQKNSWQLIECTGLGELGAALYKQLKNSPMKVSVMIVQCDPEICLQRIQNRDWSQIPYPKVEEKISDTIYRLASEFEENLIWKTFSQRELFYIENQYSKDIEQIIFSFLEKISLWERF